MCNISVFCRNVWCQHLKTLNLHEAKTSACSSMNWCNDCESVSASLTDLIIRLALVVLMVAFSAAMFFYNKVHISGSDCRGEICKTQVFTLGSQFSVCLVQQRKQKKNILSNFIMYQTLPVLKKHVAQDVSEASGRIRNTCLYKSIMRGRAVILWLKYIFCHISVGQQKADAETRGQHWAWLPWWC